MQVGSYVLDWSATKLRDGGPVISVPAPLAGQVDGALLVAYVVGPPAQPDAPITAVDPGWHALDEVLHFRRFIRPWSPSDPPTYGFVWDPSAVAEASIAAIVSVVLASQLVGATAQPVCQKANDVPCEGPAWNLNPAQQDPPYPQAATDWRALSIPGLQAGDLVLAGYAAHATAKSAVFNINGTVFQTTSPQRTNGQTGLYLGVAAAQMPSDGDSPVVVATPLGAIWQHAMATQTAIR